MFISRPLVYFVVWGIGGAKYACQVKPWSSWFCMDGGNDQAFVRTLDVSTNLNQEVKDAEEAILQHWMQFSTCIVILNGNGKGMQAIGGAGSKCWWCKEHRFAEQG